VTLILEKVNDKIDLIIKELTFYSQVGLDGPFPGEVIRSYTRFVDGFNTREAPYIVETFIDLGQVRKSDVGNPVVTHRTIGRSNLKVVEPGGSFLHKIIARRHPTYRNGWEKTILPAGLKVFGPGISKINIYQVGIPETIGQPAGHSLITQWNGF